MLSGGTGLAGAGDFPLLKGPHVVTDPARLPEYPSPSCVSYPVIGRIDEDLGCVAQTPDGRENGSRVCPGLHIDCEGLCGDVELHTIYLGEDAHGVNDRVRSPQSRDAERLHHPSGAHVER